MKNINDRFDQISTESKQFKEINSELENQIVQLKACLNGVKFPFSIASPVSCFEFSTMGVVVVNSLFNDIICSKSVSEEFSAIMFL
jgi:hypothetical protein